MALKQHGLAHHRRQFREDQHLLQLTKLTLLEMLDHSRHFKQARVLTLALSLMLLCLLFKIHKAVTDQLVKTLFLARFTQFVNILLRVTWQLTTTLQQLS